MNISPNQPFKHVYTIYLHPYLGYLIDSYIVELDAKERLTYKHQNIAGKNATEFESGLDEIDFKIISLIDRLDEEYITKHFSNKKITPSEFFAKVFDPHKTDDGIKKLIQKHVDGIKSQIIPLLKDRMVFEMGKDGEPIYKELFFADEPAVVTFHFRRDEEKTVYFPILYKKKEKIVFQFKNAYIINNLPACMILGNTIYLFEKDVEGNKIKPFLQKSNIEIPRKLEDTYYKKFIQPLIAEFDVYAQGFEIKSEVADSKAVLSFSSILSSGIGSQLNLLNDKNENSDFLEEQILFELNFQYGSFLFPSSDPLPVFVKLEKTNNSYIFHKIKRFKSWELDKLAWFEKKEIVFRNSKHLSEKYAALDWLNRNIDELKALGIELKQSIKDNTYFIGKSEINLTIDEGYDWFDVKAKVIFGDYEISFWQIRKLILAKKKEFTLPNGQIAIIPEEWLSKFADLFAFAKPENDTQEIKLDKHHLGVLGDLKNNQYATVRTSNKLEKLKDFTQIEDFPLPEGFKGSLRPYQKAGYNWLRFLQSYNLGGCLADDMGLGKTIQTLALILSAKENKATQASILIVPTSLITNWQLEAKKFTPSLNVYTHTGAGRTKNVDLFNNYDLVISTYGTLRQDVEILHKYYYNYIILDEAQAIKNPNSQTTKEITKLKSKNKLSLTGTPIENSSLDLWSQMTFCNTGLLGTLPFFKDFYLNPIEKKTNLDKLKKLHSIIKPFILRRLKTQVLKDLPPKVENIHYCDMLPDQEKFYEETKSYYRNMIIEQDGKQSLNKENKTFVLLQGLTKLRQIANHPAMLGEENNQASGKMEQIMIMIQNLVEQNHKVLIFSQFVKIYLF